MKKYITYLLLISTFACSSILCQAQEYTNKDSLEELDDLLFGASVLINVLIEENIAGMRSVQDRINSDKNALSKMVPEVPPVGLSPTGRRLYASYHRDYSKFLDDMYGPFQKESSDIIQLLTSLKEHKVNQGEDLPDFDQELSKITKRVEDLNRRLEETPRAVEIFYEHQLQKLQKDFAHSM